MNLTFLKNLFSILNFLGTNARAWKYFYSKDFYKGNTSFSNSLRNISFFKYNYIILILLTIGYNVMVDQHLFYAIFLLIAMFILYDKQKGIVQLFSVHYIFLAFLLIAYMRAADLQGLLVTLLVPLLVIAFHAHHCKRFPNRQAHNADRIEYDSQIARQTAQNYRRCRHYENSYRSRISPYRNREENNGEGMIIIIVIIVTCVLLSDKAPINRIDLELSGNLKDTCPLSLMALKNQAEKCWDYEYVNETLISSPILQSMNTGF